MAVTSGFFDSINGDRKYNARQMAELFDGLINDGVYETIYKQFRVSPNTGLAVQVDTGRGWFKHTWIKNDNIRVLYINSPDSLLPRIDAVVIEVDHRDSGRRDDIKVITGTPSASPQRPTLSKTDELFQVPLAYVRVNSGATSITTSNITNMVGTSSCPFVTGVVEVMDIDWLIAQWQSQWKDRLKDHESDWEKWFGEHTYLYENEWIDWLAKINDKMIGHEYDFIDWFARLQAMLEDDIAANLANRIIQLENIVDELLRKGIILNTIDDSDDDPIIDSYNHPIDGVIKFAVGQGNCTC